MLTEDDQRRAFEHTVKAFEYLEADLIAVIVAELVKGTDELEGGVAVSIAALKTIQNHRKAIYNAIKADFSQSFTKNAVTDVRNIHAGKEALDWAKTEAGKIAAEALRDSQQGVERLLGQIREGARQGYYQTARNAARYMNVVGYEKALKTAVEALGEQGITAYTYLRKDGTVVRVPVDVGIRREMTRGGKDRFFSQQMDIAKYTGANFVDVSICSDARESHALWQGKRYQLNGSGKYKNFAEACHLGDMVEGYGGYNCHHTIALVYEPNAEFSFEDPLEGTGYTTEQVRELKTKQRRLENEKRKAVRSQKALEAMGEKDKQLTAKINGYNAQLRQLTSEHSAVLRRESWRERVYGGGKFGVHLDSKQMEYVDSFKREADKWRARVAEGTTIHLPSQNKHIPGTKEYEEKLASNRAKGIQPQSYVTITAEECQELINKHAGKGSAVIVKGVWRNKEIASADGIIGVAVGQDGNSYRTKEFTIHYSRKGTHLVPKREGRR